MGKKDRRALGRRRRAQAQSHEQNLAVPPAVRPSQPGKKKKVADLPLAGATPQKKQANKASRINLLKRVRQTDLTLGELTVERLAKFAPVGIISRAEKIMVRRRLALVAIFLTLLAAVLSGVGNYMVVDSTPQQAVDSYMKSLQDGHYLRGLGRSVYRNEKAVYLKDSMYRAARGRVEDYSIVSIEEQTDTALATVEATVEGENQQVDLSLRKVHRTGLFNDHWELAQEPQVYARLKASFALDSLLVNGRTLKLGEGTTASNSGPGVSWDIPLLPGNYEVSLSEDSYYALAQEDPTLTVGLADRQEQTLNLSLRPSPRMWRETNDAINNWLSTCAMSHSLQPRDCPISALYSDNGILLRDAAVLPSASASASPGASSSPSSVKPADISDVEWKLIKEPNLVLEEDQTDPTHWTALDSTEATLELTYSVDDVTYTETIPFTVKADVSSTGDSAKVEVGLGEQKEGTLRQANHSKATPTATSSSSH